MSSIPAPNIFQDATQIAQMPQNALQEYARTAQLQQQTAASAQEMQQRQQLQPGALQQQSQQTQAQQMQLQQQQLDLQDAQNAHKLGPQFLQKDDSGKITGFDNEGYYNALIGTGMNPAKVNQLRMQNVTYQQNLQKLGKDQLDLQNEKNDNAYQIVEPLRQAANDPKADAGHVNQVWQSIAPQLLKLGLNPAELPASFATPQEAAQKLQDFETELGQHKQMLADAKTEERKRRRMRPRRAKPSRPKPAARLAAHNDGNHPAEWRETSPRLRWATCMASLMIPAPAPRIKRDDAPSQYRENHAAKSTRSRSPEEIHLTGDCHARTQRGGETSDAGHRVAFPPIISSRKPEIPRKRLSRRRQLSDPTWNSQNGGSRFHRRQIAGQCGSLAPAKSLTDKGCHCRSTADAAKDIHRRAGFRSAITCRRAARLEADGPVDERTL